MRNKVLILFFLSWTFVTLSVTQVVPLRFKHKPVIDSILYGNHDERVVQMKKLFQSVQSDTVTKKTVLLDLHFKEKYLNDQEFNYQKETGGKSFFQRLLERIGNLLHNLFGINTFSKYSDLTVLVFKILCGLVVMVVIYFLIRMLMNHKGTWFFRKKNESIAIDINNTEQLIQSADFEQLISEIEKQGDTRQSIRLHYLWLLKNMKDDEFIVWLPEKTNADYMSELKDETLRKKFSYLSYLYNYIWYGEFSIGDEDYFLAKKAFLNYLKRDRQHG